MNNNIFTERSDGIIGLLAIFIAISTLSFTVWEGYEIRKHNRLSVKPMILLDYTYSTNVIQDIGNTDTTLTFEKTLKLFISNKGLGPSVIKSFEIIVSDKNGDIQTFNDWRPLFKEVLNDKKSDIFFKSYASFEIDDVLVSNKKIMLYDLYWTDNGIDIPQNLEITLNIDYESIYGESFKLREELLFKK